MKNNEAAATGQETSTGICVNEGCGRPAEGALCDECALEWALFHREQRDGVGPADPGVALAAEAFRKSSE